MREIKFRAWDKVRKEWLPRKFYISFNGMVQDGHPSSRNPALWVYSKADVELMQFTGLKDKNGKEIYEGDIVEAWSEGSKGTFQIMWRGDGGGTPCWLLYPAYQHKHQWYLAASREVDGFVYDRGIEIIGNIYENAELLESTKTK